VSRGHRWLVAVLVVVGVVYAYLLLTAPVAAWWQEMRYEIGPRLPDRLQARWYRLARYDEADIHVLLWMPVSMLVVGAVRGWWRLAAAWGVIVAGLAFEVAQAMVGREFERIDVLGNVVGVVIGAAIATLVTWSWDRYRHRPVVPVGHRS
jgi:hypothetical protein